MKFKTLIFILSIPVLLISQSITMGNPISSSYFRSVYGNQDVGYFSFRYEDEKTFIDILDPTSFSVKKSIPSENVTSYSSVINNKIVVFFNNNGTITYKELDLKAAKFGEEKTLLKYDSEKHPKITFEFTPNHILILVSDRQTNFEYFVRGAAYYGDFEAENIYKGKAYAFDFSFNEVFNSDLNFKLDEEFHLRDIHTSYNGLDKEFYVITDIVTTGTMVKQTNVMEFKRFLNVIDNDANNEIKEIDFEEGSLVFGYNITNVSEGKNIGQRLIMDKTEGKMKVQTFYIGSDRNISEKEMPLLGHHTFDEERYLSGNGFFLSSDVIKNEILENGNLLSLHRINLDHGKYWSGSRFKNYYFVETTTKGEVVDVKGVPVFDRNGAATTKNRFFYTYDEGFYNIVYIDNYADQKDKNGNKMDGNYLVAATLDKDGTLTKKVLTHEAKFDKTKTYRLLQNTFVNKNGDFITYAYKKKKEDVPFTIKF